MKPSRLPMRPEGLAGRIFGKVMEATNESAYHRALSLLDAARDAAVVEVGFGTGRLVELLLDRVPDGQIAGVDPAATMVDVARSRSAVRVAGERVDLRLGEAGRLPWADASFDAALALHCFQFWADPVAAAREVLRVLRPGGRFVVVLREHPPGRAPAWLPNPISRGPDECAGARECLREAGFVVPDAGTSSAADEIVAVKPSAPS